jgi:creatinine amidohydrolase
MEKVRYSDMLPHEIIARRKAFPAAFIGLGGLEWHGEHQGVGLDALKAQKLCELAAGQSGGFAMPTIWYGEPRTEKIVEATNYDQPDIVAKWQLPPENFTEQYFGKSGAEQIEFYTQLVYHVLVQMNTLGMKVVIMVAGHYPLKDWADAAIARFQAVKRYAATRCYCGIEFDFPRPVDQEKAGGDHGAHWETSYLWYLRPDCVDLSIYNGRENEKTLVGVGGKDPRKFASYELGRSACKLIVEGMVIKAKEMLQ